MAHSPETDPPAPASLDGRAFRPVWGILLILIGVAAMVGVSMWMRPSTGAESGAPGEGGERIAWKTNLAAARAEAQQAHKPVFAYFTATWCPPCQRLKTTTWTDAGVARSLAPYVTVKLDVDQNRDLSMKYQIDSIPCFMVLNDNGDVVKRSEGYMDASQFVAWVEAKPE